MPSCAVFGCKSRSNVNTDLSFHKIPSKERNDSLRKQWLHNIRRDSGLPTDDGFYICSKHFSPDCFKTDLKERFASKIGYERKPRTYLKNDAVPHLFSFAVEPKKRLHTVQKNENEEEIQTKKQIKYNTKMTDEKNRVTPLDEDSMEEQDKEITSGDDGTAEENTVDQRTDKHAEDEDEDGVSNDGSENETDSEESGSEESDSLDEDEAADRRSRYVEDMSDLEKQFSDLKEQLYKERIQQIEEQLDEVNHSEAKEYTGPLKQLEQECVYRIESAGHLKHYRTINLENKLQCELQAAEQHFQNEENTLIEMLTGDFEEKLRKVEEERHSSEMYSDLWSDDLFRSRKKKKGLEMHIPEKRKKPVTVTGPYIVYMLNEMDILEDWAAIRKGKSELARRKATELSAQEKYPPITACYKDGNFLYQGECFQKGDKVILDNRIDSPVNVSITGINTGEIWVSKRDGVKCKLYIAQFQKGKYTIQKASIKVEEIG